MIYLELFLAFLQIGAFSFGGGYAAMPLIQAQVIDKYHWMTQKDFTDLVTISQMTPGPIAVNGATFVGHQVAGIPGAIVATIGVILPSCIFVTILAYFYTKYRKMAMLQGILQTLRPAVVALILVAGLTILIPSLFANGNVSFASGNFQLFPFLLFLAALFALRKWKADPILVMVLCGVAELVMQAVMGWE
ncbi:MAG: chromate transporter [Bilifractor sp.]